MSLTNDVVAAWTLALIFPAVLFVAALFVHQARRPESEPMRTAGRIVRWYASHPQLALWILLLLLPMSAFVLGSVALMRTWANNAELRYYAWRALTEVPEHWPAMSIGLATLLAAGLLMMVTAHLFRNSPHRTGALR